MRIVSVLLLLLSCNEKRKVNTYYKSGFLKETHTYIGDKIVDSSLCYFDNKKNHIKSVVYWSDTINSLSVYDEKGRRLVYGKFVTKNPYFKKGKWVFSNYKLDYDSIVEYRRIENEVYINQCWLVDRVTKDFKWGSNFCEISVKDTVSVNDVLRIRFFLTFPAISFNSDIEAIVPTTDSILKPDFSNFLEIPRDTMASLKDDGIPHNEIPKEVSQNHVIEFGYIYSKVGKKRIRGILIEYDKSTKPRIERRIYFEKEVFVKAK